MGINDQNRRIKAMKEIDKRLEALRVEFGSRFAENMKPYIFEEVGSELDYCSSTLAKYHNDWRSKKGLFVNEKH